MRNRALRFWLSLALYAMEQAAKFSAELLARRKLDDVAFSYKILWPVLREGQAPVFRGISGRVDAALSYWEFSK